MAALADRDNGEFGRQIIGVIKKQKKKKKKEVLCVHIVLGVVTAPRPLNREN